MSAMKELPVVGVVMGSASDWPIMRTACEMLERFGVPHEARVLSAHRMPDEMFAYAEGARARGLAAIIAGAGTGKLRLPNFWARRQKPDLSLSGWFQRYFVPAPIHSISYFESVL